MQSMPRLWEPAPIHRVWARRATLLFVVLIAGLVFACSRKQDAVEKKADLPAGEHLWVRHILVRYSGAQGASGSIRRSRASADSLARVLLQRARAGEDFAALAKQYSDDPSAADGGEIAPLEPRDAPPEFMQAAAALAPGQISDVVESDMGLHLIQRRDMRQCTAQHILVRYRGAVSAPDSIVRSREEALKLADRLLSDVRNPDGSFPVAALLFSDDTMTSRAGGYLGTFSPGKMDPNFEKVAFALQEGEISELVETPYGFHIIRRIADVQIRVAHILFTYAGVGQIVEVNRTREAALQRAHDAAFRASQGEDFAALARELSDDRHTGEKGGDLGPIRAGQMVPEFEDAAFHLSPGQVSVVVETEFGFHVIKRIQ